ncbi:acetyl esterase/lipase [Neisseria sp. HSC-16F19]|nr:alpha/beta hydrolase [Neisseria sp. HSC-16F19]MCP2041581.1 acetyl esterase/lipase [Neisseria sp. HSC-16F19]
MKYLKISALYLSAFVLSFAVGLGSFMLLNRDTSMQVNWSEQVGTIHTDLTYGDGQAHKYDLYLPADKSKSAYGLVVYLHPGGFTTGDKADDAEIAKWFTSKGYVATSINYTLHNAENPTASVKTMAEEIKTAIPVVVAKAQELGYNIDKMAVGGGSAGHGLAAIYSFRDGAKAPVPIAFTFGMVGPTSLEMDVTDGMDFANAAPLLAAISGEPITAQTIKSGEYKDLVKPVEAYRWVTPDSPPTLYGFGALDRVMPFSYQPIQKALADNNVPHDVIIFEKSGHGLHRDKDKAKLYLDKLNEYFEKYMPVK